MIKTIRKLFCIVMAVSLILSCNIIPVKAVESVPEIVFVGVEHSPLVEGDTETLYIASKNTDKVQYRLFLYSEATKKSQEITAGYSSEVIANQPYEIKFPGAFNKGKYVITVYVKKSGTLGNKTESNIYYDSKYISYLNCVSRDNSCRVYASGQLEPVRNTYALGEKIKIQELRNISGMKAPYKYKLHAYDMTRNIWLKDITNYDSYLEWMPNEAGSYALDVWATSYDSKAKYEAWKIKTIEVEQTQNFSSEGTNGGSLDVDHPENIQGSVSVTGNNIILSNMVINKNLFILSGNTTYNNITVKGKIIIDANNGPINFNNIKADNVEIYSQGTVTANFNDSTISNVKIYSKGTANVIVDGKSSISRISANTDAAVNVKQGTVSNIDITNEYKTVKNIYLEGTIENLNIYSKTSITSGFTSNVKNIKIYSTESIDFRGKFGAITVNSPTKINLSADTSVLNLYAYSNFEMWLESSAKVLNLVKNGYSVTASGLGQVSTGGTQTIPSVKEPAITAVFPVNEYTLEVKFDKEVTYANAEDYVIVDGSELIPIDELKIKTTDKTRVILKVNQIYSNIKYSLYYKNLDTKITFTYNGTPRKITIDTTPNTITIYKSSNKAFYISNIIHNTFATDKYTLEIKEIKSTQYGKVYDIDTILKSVSITNKPQTLDEGMQYYTYLVTGNKWGEDCSASINCMINDNVVPMNYTMTVTLTDNNDDVITTKDILIKVLQ